MRYGHFGLTVVHEAVDGNHPNVIQYLIGKGADVNAVNCNRSTPLHWAVGKGSIDCVRVLIECGADITMLDDYCQTPAMAAEKYGRRKILKLLKSVGM